MSTDAQKRAQAKYRKQNEYALHFSLNRKTDNDIIQYFESQDNKLRTFKEIIRKYINQNNK